MQLARYLRLRWWWLLLLGALIGGASGYGVSHAITPVYRTDATLLVNQTQTPGTIAYNDILTSERLTMTYRELISQWPVLEAVGRNPDIDMSAGELAGLIDVDVVEDTQLLRLSVEHTDPAMATLIANATAEAFIETNGDDGLTRPGTVSIVEPAVVPGGPVRPRTMVNTIIGSLAGLFIALAVAMAYEYLDDTLKTPEEIEAAAGIATLGGVSRFPHGSSPGGTLIVASPERSPAAEAYRALRTNLQFSKFDAQTLLVSSANQAEGKTTTVANLAAAMAQTGLKTIVVDSDLRRPALHRVFGVSNGAGLTNALLSDEPQIMPLLQQTGVENLHVLASGPQPPNPSELLSSRRMDRVVAALKKEAEIVLFDSPPTLAVADASVLAAKVDGTMLVVDSGRTRAESLRRATEAVSRSKSRVLGAVLNKLTKRDHGYYGYYDYYSSSSSESSNGKRWLPWTRKARGAEVRSNA